LIYLTLAEGHDRWEQVGRRHQLKSEGELWTLASLLGGDWFPVLKREVADWCFDNIGAYRIIEHIPTPPPGQRVNVGPGQGDSWRIEFKTDTDMAFFKMRWG
jgi:hypothetical protein